MIGTIKKFFGFTPSTDFKQLVIQGAKIIDVRTRTEYANGHIDGSVNIPLNELRGIVEKFSKNTVLITCCASGIRSESAKNFLIGIGFAKVYNGGGCESLKLKLR